MSYEIPLPMPDELAKKPIRNASEVHKYLEEHGIRPIAVVVDNASAKIVVYTETELSEDDKKRLMDIVMEYYRKHIGLVEAKKKSK